MNNIGSSVECEGQWEGVWWVYYGGMLDKIMGVLAPHVCVVCGSEGSLLCAWCRPDALLVVPERCYRCSALSAQSAVCDKCHKHSPLQHVWVGGLYQGVAKDLVYGLKFARARAAAQLIASLLDETVPALPAGTVVTYIPTASSRVRLRGYDQARLIAQAFAGTRGLDMKPLLRRQGQSRQVGADRKHRLEQAAKNYVATETSSIKNKEVLIIDDILTTGATLESAAKVLKKAGAKQLHAAVFAQKQ